jgi:hypothetical protein
MKNLIYLGISELETLPESLLKIPLIKLEIFDYENVLPNNIEKFQSLKIVEIHPWNDPVPPAFTKLRNLRVLQVSDSGFDEFKGKDMFYSYTVVSRRQFSW